MCRTLEEIVTSQLKDNLRENTISTPHQFGFRSDISTENAAQNLLNQIYQAFENGEFVIGIILNLTKAFDLINRSYFLFKWFLYEKRDIEKD